MTIDVTSLYNRKRINPWERTSVGDVFEKITYSFPNKEAIVSRDGACANPAYARVTYQEADDLANKFANALLRKGLNRADRILLFCDNSTEAYIAKIAIAKAGLVVTPINTRMAEDVIDYLIDLVEPSFFIADDVHWDALETVFENKGINLDVTIPIEGGQVEGSQTFDEFIETESTTRPEVDIDGNDIWEILFTSGTTSMPKGVMISHHSTFYAGYNMALTFSRNLAFEGDLKIQSFLPVIYHVADQVIPLAAFLSAGTFVLGRKVDLEQTAQSVTEEGVTALWAGSPNFVSKLADLYADYPGKYNFSTLTNIAYGWSSLDPRVHQKYKEICGDQVVLWELFSQTESVAGFRFWHDQFIDTYEAHAPVRNYVGVPSPGLSAKVVDKQGTEIKKPFVEGEVVYQSSIMFSGYYKNEAATKEAVKDGWFHSGDAVMYDENGLIIMVDRFKDIIKSGGENVSSIRVEAALNLHGSVENAAVVGLKNEKWGEQVTAFVIVKEGHSITEEDLIHFAGEKLAGFEKPKEVYFVNEFPETVGGKILKYKLRESAEDYKLSTVI